MATFWSLVLLLLFGCNFVHLQLTSFMDRMKEPIWDRDIPIVSITLNGAFLVSAVIFAIGMFFLFRWLQSPKMADLLIDTESELRKVTWPTTQEVINSSMVVVASVVILMGFLAGTDFVLGKLVKRLIFG